MDEYLMVGSDSSIITIDVEDAFHRFSIEVGGETVEFRPADVKWEVTKTAYASYARKEFTRKGVRKKVKLHRLLLNAKEGEYVDHRNHNGLDNRRANIRIATPQQNQFNKNAKRGKKFKGVTQLKGCKKYTAFICGKKIASFKTPEEAALAYNAKALEVFGEFARLNKVEV
jgi:hypothetical protein